MVSKYRRTHLPSITGVVLFLIFAIGFVWTIYAFAQSLARLSGALTL